MDQMTGDIDVQTGVLGDVPPPSETNRDRVRRLLFAPLGFRFPKAMTEADGRAQLDRIADELAYLSDWHLGALARMLRPHGQGSARNFWPDRATFIAFAHICQPLPLAQDPKLVSWFASVEGQRMVQEGTLVETWDWFERHRVPPYKPEHRRLVATQAAENARRLLLVEERERLGHEVTPDNLAWARHYRAERDRLAAMVASSDAA